MDSWSCVWFGIVNMFFLPRDCNHVLQREASKPRSVLSWGLWRSFADDWVQQVSSVIQQWHFPCCISKPTQRRQSVWFWLVNTSLVKNVFCNTLSMSKRSCGISRAFLTPSEKEMVLCQKQIILILKKDCSCIGIFNPQEFIWGLMLANTCFHGAWASGSGSQMSSSTSSSPQSCCRGRMERARMERTRALMGQWLQEMPEGLQPGSASQWLAKPSFATGQANSPFFFKENEDWVDFTLNFILSPGWTETG